MQYQLFLATTLILLSARLTLADDNAPASNSKPESPITDSSKADEGPYGSALKEVEDIRKQLGPEYSIESKELGIERDRDITNPPKNDKPGEEWNGTKLYQQVRELVNKFRQDARHLEELAAHAEQLSEFALADQLREMAHRQWEAARELSQPHSLPSHLQPWRPTSNPPQASPPSASYPPRTPRQENTTTQESPAETTPAYGVPSAPSQRFSVPSKPERKKY